MKYDFDLEDKSKKRKQLFLRILLVFMEFAVVIFIAYSVTHYGLEKMNISGEYMSPTLKHGDEILIDKIIYHIKSVKREDVIVVKHNGSEHSYYSTYRVVGLPGEKLNIKDGYIYINGKRLKEKYNFPKMDSEGLAEEKINLASDEYFVLCDNRNECEDSRNANIGNVSRDNIVGKAWMKMNSWALISRINNFKKEKNK